MAARSVCAALCVLAVLCSPGVAAKPTPGHYYGFEADETKPFSVVGVDAELRVARNRRSLRPGSYVKLTASCPGRRPDLAFTVRLAGDRIHRDTVFSEAGARRGVRYRLVGSVRGGYARIVYTLSRCKVSPVGVALYLNGRRPFSGCRRQRAETLASSPTGRVFEQYRLERSGQFFPYAYGCVYGGGGAVLLGRNYDEETIAHPVVAGTLAAYASVGCGIGACNSAMVVQALDFPGPPGLRLPAFLGGGYLSSVVESIVLKPNGSLAWLVLRSGGTSGQEPAPVREVYAVDSQGWRRLDSGPGVAGPLRLDAGTSLLSWMNGGAVPTAPLD